MNITKAILNLIPNAKFETNIEYGNGVCPIIDEAIYNNNFIWSEGNTEEKPSWLEIVTECLEILKREKKDEVNRYREEIIFQGVPYTFPGDIEGHIQTRDEIDFRNIMANASVAQIYIANGMTDEIMQFRDVEDKIHDLTPQQIIDLSIAVMGYCSFIYQKSWNHKDNIQNFTIDPQNILGSYQLLKNYDIYSNWE